MQIISVDSVFSKPVYHLPIDDKHKFFPIGGGTKLYTQFNGENGNYALQIGDNGKTIDVSEVRYEVRRVATKWLLFKRVPVLIRHATLLNGEVKKDRIQSGADIVYDVNTGKRIIVISKNLFIENLPEKGVSESTRRVLCRLLLVGNGHFQPFVEKERFELRKTGMFVGLTEASRRKHKFVEFEGKQYYFKLPEFLIPKVFEGLFYGNKVHVGSYDSIINHLNQVLPKVFNLTDTHKGEVKVQLPYYSDVEGVRESLQSRMDEQGIKLGWRKQHEFNNSSDPIKSYVGITNAHYGYQTPAEFSAHIEAMNQETDRRNAQFTQDMNALNKSFEEIKAKIDNLPKFD